jgi:hypothetical protein
VAIFYAKIANYTFFGKIFFCTKHYLTLKNFNVLFRLLCFALENKTICAVICAQEILQKHINCDNML